MDIQIDRARNDPERPTPLSTISRTFEVRSTETRNASPISWKGVFAGVLVAFLIQLTLLSLGVALGGSSLKSIIQGSTRLVGLGTSSAFWFALSTILSLYFGSYVGGRLSGPISIRVGQYQGVVISALFFALLLTQLGTTFGVLSRSLSGAAGALGQTMGEVSKNPMVQDAIRTSLGKLPLKSPPEQVVGELASRLIRGNRTGARDYLVQQTGLSPKEADIKINQLISSTEENLKSIGGATAQVISIAGWTLFSALLLGTFFSFLGGGAGVAAHFDRNLAPKRPTQEKTKTAA